MTDAARSYSLQLTGEPRRLTLPGFDAGRMRVRGWGASPGAWHINVGLIGWFRLGL